MEIERSTQINHQLGIQGSVCGLKSVRASFLEAKQLAVNSFIKLTYGPPPAIILFDLY